MLGDKGQLGDKCRTRATTAPGRLMRQMVGHDGGHHERIGDRIDRIIYNN